MQRLSDLQEMSQGPVAEKPVFTQAADNIENSSGLMAASGLAPVSREDATFIQQMRSKYLGGDR